MPAVPPSQQINSFMQQNDPYYSSFIVLTEHTAITIEHTIIPPHCDNAEVHNAEVRIRGLGNTTALNSNVESLAPMELCNFS